MTKPAAHKKHTTGRLQLASILRQTARAVGYLVSALAVVSSCQSSALNCNAPGVVCDL